MTFEVYGRFVQRDGLLVHVKEIVVTVYDRGGNLKVIFAVAFGGSSGRGLTTFGS